MAPMNQCHPRFPKTPPLLRPRTPAPLAALPGVAPRCPRDVIPPTHPHSGTLALHPQARRVQDVPRAHPSLPRLLTGSAFPKGFVNPRCRVHLPWSRGGTAPRSLSRPSPGSAVCPHHVLLSRLWFEAVTSPRLKSSISIYLHERESAD